MNDEDRSLVLCIFKDVRCPNCKKLLAKVSEDTTGTLSLWCARCKKDVIVRASKKAE